MVPGYLFEITASPMKFFRLHALFQRHALYGMVIWGHSSAAWNILLRQKRALRIIPSSGNREHCSPKDLSVFTVYKPVYLQCLDQAEGERK